MEDTTQTPESSPGTEDYTPPDPQTFTQEQRARWLETGEVPKNDEPAKEEESAPSTPASPDSGTGTETTEPKPKRQNADTRMAQLETEIAELKREKARQIEQLLEERRRLRQDLSEPAELKAESKEPGSERPKRPRWDDFAGDWDAYDQAMDKYQEDLSDWKAAQRLQAERQSEEQRRQQQTIEQHNAEVRANWETRLAATKVTRPDFDEVVRSVELPLNPVMDGYLLNSPVGPELVYQLCKNPAEAARIAKLSPFECVDALARMALSASAPAQSPPNVSAAKPPGTQLSGVHRAPEDEAQAAIESGNVGRYIEVMNARDAARLQGK